MREDMESILSELRSSRTKVLVELFASTFLLLYWFFSIHKFASGSFLAIRMLFALPAIANAVLWLIWLMSYWFAFLSRSVSDIDEVEYMRSRLRYYKRIERLVDVLVAFQFLAMTMTMAMFGLGYI